MLLDLAGFDPRYVSIPHDLTGIDLKYLSMTLDLAGFNPSYYFIWLGWTQDKFYAQGLARIDLT